jgi:hypothetical protein
MALHGLLRSCVAAIASVLVVTVTLAGPAQNATAAEFKAHDITIEAPWSRATPGGAKVGAGYLTVRNAGVTPDWLVAVTSSIAERVEIHQMSMTDGMMKMRQATGGVEVPAGGAVALAPGGYHLMLVGLKQPLKEGETFPATLIFKEAGEVAVTFEVRGVGAGPGDGGEHRH